MPTLKELEAKIEALSKQVTELKSDNKILEEMVADSQASNPYADKIKVVVVGAVALVAMALIIGGEIWTSVSGSRSLFQGTGLYVVVAAIMAIAVVATVTYAIARGRNLDIQTKFGPKGGEMKAKVNHRTKN